MKSRCQTDIISTKNILLDLIPGSHETKCKNKRSRFFFIGGKRDKSLVAQSQISSKAEKGGRRSFVSHKGEETVLTFLKFFLKTLKIKSNYGVNYPMH